MRYLDGNQMFRLCEIKNLKIELTITMTMPFVHSITHALSELTLVNVLIARIHQIDVVQGQLLRAVVLFEKML